MKKIFKEYLFTKHILVNESSEAGENSFETVFSLAKLFSVKITSGAELACRNMLPFTAEQLGKDVPEAFYRGFPDSVRELSPDQLLFDQMVHYAVTYGFGDFSHPGRSLFEADFERTAFSEDVEPVEFVILDAKAAGEKLRGLLDDLLRSSRPLSEGQLALVTDAVREYGYAPAQIASKDTAVRLLITLRDLSYAAFLSLPDVIKAVDVIAFGQYTEEFVRKLRTNQRGLHFAYSIRKLNLKNQDRKLVTALIDRLIADLEGRADGGEAVFRVCCEKKKIWCGLLHHLHYRPKQEAGARFVSLIRSRENSSALSGFEKKMAEEGPVEAAAFLAKEKGSAMLLRSLNYLVSRCQTREDILAVTDLIDSSSPVLLIQLLLRYSCYHDRKGKARVFCYLHRQMNTVYTESPEETSRRKTVLNRRTVKLLSDMLQKRLACALKGRLGKVYIDPAMSRYALPIQEGSSQGGLGVLPRGSRLPIGAGKKLRAFTYWEKVNDIDLSVMGLSADERITEFSWRTMASSQSGAITFSGDQTAGYNGGSEFFDITFDEFRQTWPDIRYLVFCDNVYSRVNFDKCFCKAGYMLRDEEDSGEIFEPKTVRSSFIINCQSTFAYLFGIDLETREIVWLNMARAGISQIARTDDIVKMTDFFHITEAINVRSFFEMAAAELTDDPMQADIVVADRELPCREGAEVIREYDFEKMLALMNQQ